LPTDGQNGTWSLAVTKNWHITFRIDQDKIEITNI